MMMKIVCRTNLDLRGEQWPSHLPAVPRVGDLIESLTEHPQYRDRAEGGKPTHYIRLELEVCRVTWRAEKKAEGTGFQETVYYPEIELHMSPFHRGLTPRGGLSIGAPGSIIAFYDWYAPIVGTTPSAFI